MSQTYHGGNDGIIVLMQLATGGQPGGQAGCNEADGDKCEDDGDDSEIDTTTVELIVFSCVYDSHVANCVNGTRIVREGAGC